MTKSENHAYWKDTGLEPEEINALAANDRTVAYDENGDPYMLRAEGATAKHIMDLLAAETGNRLLVLSKNSETTV